MVDKKEMFKPMMLKFSYSSLKLSCKKIIDTKLNPFCKYFWAVTKVVMGVAMLKYSYQCADF